MTGRDEGIDYARDHVGRLPVVVLFRELRMWDFFQMRRQVLFAEGRHIRVQQAGIATYYVLLTNRYPFKGEHELQVMFAHCNDPVPDPRAVVPGVPEACAAIVRKAMAKNPAERYQTAAELLADLEAILAREPTPPLNLKGQLTPHPARPAVAADAPTALWRPDPPSRPNTQHDSLPRPSGAESAASEVLPWRHFRRRRRWIERSRLEIDRQLLDRNSSIVTSGGRIKIRVATPSNVHGAATLLISIVLQRIENESYSSICKFESSFGFFSSESHLDDSENGLFW